MGEAGTGDGGGEGMGDCGVRARSFRVCVLCLLGGVHDRLGVGCGLLG